MSSEVFWIVFLLFHFKMLGISMRLYFSQDERLWLMCCHWDDVYVSDSVLNKVKNRTSVSAKWHFSIELKLVDWIKNWMNHYEKCISLKDWWIATYYFSIFFFVFNNFLYSEEIQQSKGEESPPSGGEGSHGRRVCQGGRSQQGSLQSSCPVAWAWVVQIGLIFRSCYCRFVLSGLNLKNVPLVEI